jgi:hypothetical protein
MEAPHGSNYFRSRAKQEMIGIAKEHLGASPSKKLREEAFDGSASPHRHETRRFHVAVGGSENPASGKCLAVIFSKDKFDACLHGFP